MIFSCSKTPSDAPIDSYRDVEFNIDMNKAISEGLFNVNIDVLVLLIDSVNEYVMSDENGDQIFSITISNLIFGKTYEYQYAVNETLEILEGDRTFIVYDYENLLSDYYGELNPTTIIFLVNMSYQIESGNFDSDADFLDVAGTFNNWEGTDFHLAAIENNVYTITITDIEVGDEIEFKFRINGETWENPNPEVSNCVIDSDGYINRAHTVEQGENSLEYWYDDASGN
jgi:hypothetical protein